MRTCFWNLCFKGNIWPICLFQSQALQNDHESLYFQWKMEALIHQRNRAVKKQIRQNLPKNHTHTHKQRFLHTIRVVCKAWFKSLIYLICTSDLSQTFASEHGPSQCSRVTAWDISVPIFPCDFAGFDLDLRNRNVLDFDCTLPETNMAPENGWLEYYLPFGMAYFQVLC